MPRVILLFFIILSCLSSLAQHKQELLLHEDWLFRGSDSSRWFPAKVPGTVHTDLFYTDQIPDPYLYENEKQLQWIENKSWEYKCTFQVEDAFLLYSNIELVFEGLDTYAKVYLNQQLILDAANMFRSSKINIKPLIKRRNNHLRIVFDPAVKNGKEKSKQLTYTLPGDEKVFTRKAQYQYGWDWGPRFVGCGIWKPVKLCGWNRARITDAHLNTLSFDSKEAQLSINIGIQSAAKHSTRLRIRNPFLTSSPVLKTELTAGANQLTIPFNLANPQLWWCNGYGKPYLYRFNIELWNDNILEDTFSIQAGIRTIELVQETDAFGSSFYFKLNHEPVFIKGANWIPVSSFPNSGDSSSYRLLLQEAVKANMNMLRVWGGGIYEDDLFYNYCDQLGILVWQDFMFACAMYPGDSSFLNNVEQEAIDNIKRIRSHSCLALWCGNNEINEGWHNWGWQKQYRYSYADSANIWNNYTLLFENKLKNLVQQFNPGTPYWPSSPSIGWGRKESLLKGDAHYWGVWWGMEDFDKYETKTGRFMSEYGFQGMPPVSYYKQFCGDTLSLNSPCVKLHQKHPKGFETINTYMERDFLVPQNFAEYVYVSQLLQAYGIKKAVESHRHKKPYCMGTLYWQFNDCWPVCSWSSLDAKGNAKALYYQIKKSYQDLLLSFSQQRDNWQLFIVSDNRESVSGTLTYRICTMEGKTLLQKNLPLKLPAKSSAVYLSLQENELSGFKKNEIFLQATFNAENNQLSASCIHFFVKPKDLLLKKPSVKIKVNEDQKIIELSSNVLVKGLYLYTSTKELKLDDNFFDLAPGEKKIITYQDENLSREEIKWMSLYTTLNH